MRRIRQANQDCLTCGGQEPFDAYDDGDGDGYHRYVCPDCADTLVQGYRYRHEIEPRYRHDAPTLPPPWISNTALFIDTNAGWTTWELWWTDDRHYVTAINGVPVHGDPIVLELISIIEDLL